MSDLVAEELRWGSEKKLQQWLLENVEVLSNTCGFQLQRAEQYMPHGRLEVDILARTQDGAPVVIECQKDESDHSHLGKLLTYMRALDASVGVWVAFRFNKDHVDVLRWLSEGSGADLQLYAVRAYRVKVGRETAGKLDLSYCPPQAPTDPPGGGARDDLGRAYADFWKQVMKRLRGKPLPAGVRPPSKEPQKNWMALSTGRYDIHYGASFGQLGLHVSLVFRHEDGDTNWDRLRWARRHYGEELERAFQGRCREIRWDRARKQAYLRIYWPGDARPPGWVRRASEADRARAARWTADALKRLIDFWQPKLRELK